MTIMFTSSTFIYIIAVLPITFFAMAIIWTWSVARHSAFLSHVTFTDTHSSRSITRISQIIVTLTEKHTEIYLISWCGNFVEKRSLRIVSGDSLETIRKLCLSPQNFHTRKLRESTVFFPVSILVYYENKTLANIPHYSNVLRYSVEFPSYRNQSIDLFFKTIDWFLQNDQECQTTLKWKGILTWSRLKESNYTLRFFLKWTKFS